MPVKVRKRFTFSLRTLFVGQLLVVVAACCLVGHVRSRREAVITISQNGGLVTSTFAFKTHRRDMEQIESRRRIAPARRDWWEFALGDDQFGIYIRDCAVSSETVNAIARLTEIEQLDLSGTTFSDDDLAALSSLRNLRSLNLNGCNITDDGVLHIACMSKLEWLELTDTRISNIALDHISRLSELQVLRVSGTQIDGRNLPRLSKLPALREITCGHSEKGGTAITSKCYDELARQLPQCHIVGSFVE